MYMTTDCDFWSSTLDSGLYKFQNRKWFLNGKIYFVSLSSVTNSHISPTGTKLRETSCQEISLLYNKTQPNPTRPIQIQMYIQQVN